MTRDQNLALTDPANASGGVILKSTDALTFLALLGIGAVALVAVALFAPVALLVFAIAGAVGLNSEAKHWRAA